MIAPFQYRVGRRARFTGGRKPEAVTEQEQLLGTLQGKKVPKDEERFFRAAVKTGRVRNYYVQFQLGPWGKSGSRTLDALIYTDFGWRAFEVDGAGFVHRGDRKKAEDRLADYQRLEWLRKLQIVPRLGIEHVPDSKLMTQEQADKTAKLLLG